LFINWRTHITHNSTAFFYVVESPSTHEKICSSGEHFIWSHANLPPFKLKILESFTQGKVLYTSVVLVSVNSHIYGVYIMTSGYPLIASTN
jgi:hypothetical protein